MIQTNTVYDKRWLIWCLIGLVAMCGAMKVTGGAGFVLIFPFIFIIFSKNRPELMLYCLLLTAVLTITNTVFAPKGMIFSVAARMVYLLVGTVLTLQIVGQRNSRLTTPLLSLLAYIVYMAIVSSVGWQPIVSYLKIVLFLIVFFAFYSASNASTIRGGGRPECLRSVMLCFATFLIIGSLLLIPFPGIAKMGTDAILRSGGDVQSVGLFKGITFHSQALGPLLSVMGSVLLADLLFSVRRWDKLYLLLLGFVPVLIYYTSSRTAMGTFLAGMCFVTFVFMNLTTRVIGARWKQRALSVLMLMGVIGGVALFATPTMREAVLRFVLKYSTENSELAVDVETILVTRQGLVDAAMDNFRESPWIGNGFQVSRQMSEMQIHSWNQLLSAPIEKGVWVTAVLEEGGIFGMLLFVIFILVAFTALLSRRAYTGASALFVFLVANLGEFGFFSMSTWGGVVWGLIFMGIALDAQRERATYLLHGYPTWNRVPKELGKY